MTQYDDNHNNTVAKTNTIRAPLGMALIQHVRRQGWPSFSMCVVRDGPHSACASLGMLSFSMCVVRDGPHSACASLGMALIQHVRR